MTLDYHYAIDQCDVSDKSALAVYREKRRVWLSWIDHDEHHAISQALFAMVWADVAFRTLAHFAENLQVNALNNYLLQEFLIDGYISTQVLRIRCLVDRRKDVISIRRLLNDLRQHICLLTRENYVCFDGLPYNYEAVQQTEMEKMLGRTGPFWVPMSGPSGYETSRMAHEQFDRLAGITPTERNRTDKLPKVILEKIENWLGNSASDALAEWSHTYLAHAGGPESRQRLADSKKKITNSYVTINKITEAIKALARATEAVSAYVLNGSSMSASLMPIAQFNQFEHLDRSIIPSNSEGEASDFWNTLTQERNEFIRNVEADLVMQRA